MADKITIDVLTLDSVQCAACGYMMESIAALPDEVQAIIEYKEWSIKTQEGIGKFTELKGKVLPTICIEGDLVFESLIPQYEELIDEMTKRAPATIVDSLKKAREKGFDIPDDLSVIGFDNVFFTRYTYPELSSTEYPGRAALLSC